MATKNGSKCNSGFLFLFFPMKKQIEFKNSQKMDYNIPGVGRKFEIEMRKLAKKKQNVLTDDDYHLEKQQPLTVMKRWQMKRSEKTKQK